MKTLNTWALIGLGFLYACQSAETLNDSYLSNRSHDEAQVNWSEFLNLDAPPPQKFKIKVSDPSLITTSCGSKLHVPENAFVDIHGNVVVGEVELLWKEYHSLADQIFSEINMCYDSAGVVHHFISDGMFTIDGAQNGQPIYIADDKKIGVDLVSHSPDEHFNFYSKEDVNDNWQYITHENGAKPDSEESEKVIEKAQPIEIPKNPIELEMALIDANPKNINAFATLNPDEIIGWQTEKKLLKKHHYVFSKQKADCQLEAGSDSSFLLKFRRDNDSVTFPVIPYTKKDAALETKVRKEELAKMTAQVENIQREAANRQFIRTIQISKFATFNYDRIVEMKRPKPILANLDCPSEMFSNRQMEYALVCLSENYQIKFNHASMHTLNLDASQKNVIIAIAPDKQLYHIPLTFMKEITQPNANLDLVDTGISLNTSDDLDDFITQLKNS